jgi:hypothetical protein
MEATSSFLLEDSSLDPIESPYGGGCGYLQEHPGPSQAPHSPLFIVSRLLMDQFSVGPQEGKCNPIANAIGENNSPEFLKILL